MAVPYLCMEVSNVIIKRKANNAHCTDSFFLKLLLLLRCSVLNVLMSYLSRASAKQPSDRSVCFQENHELWLWVHTAPETKQPSVECQWKFQVRCCIVCNFLFLVVWNLSTSFHRLTWPVVDIQTRMSARELIHLYNSLKLHYMYNLYLSVLYKRPVFIIGNNNNLFPSWILIYKQVKYIVSLVVCLHYERSLMDQGRNEGT